MSDKTELPKEWQQEAENVAEIAGNYLTGAKAMRDAMEKMLKNKHDTWADVRKNTDKSNIWELCNAKINIIEDLLHELTYLTPTQDGK